MPPIRPKAPLHTDQKSFCTAQTRECKKKNLARTRVYGRAFPNYQFNFTLFALFYDFTRLLVLRSNVPQSKAWKISCNFYDNWRLKKQVYYFRNQYIHSFKKIIFYTGISTLKVWFCIIFTCKKTFTNQLFSSKISV